jgi:outer membrane protein, multidrug efflux system
MKLETRNPKLETRNRIAAAALLLLCTSCAWTPLPDRSADVPERFSLYSEQEMDSTNRWWKSFQSSELDGLIHEALTNSPTIRQARARLMQAEAVAKKAGAARWPWLDFEARARAARDSLNFTTTESYSLGLSAAYELDLWGRVRSNVEAAAMDREASRERFSSAAMTLASQTALRWIGTISQQLQTDLIRSQLKANRESLELVELRFRKAQASALDVFQQRQTVAATEALLPQIELAQEVQRNELAALLGRADFQTLEIASTRLPNIGNPPAVGIPAAVLANRPDVRQAGLNLRSADWQVRAAQADRLPAVRLTGSYEYASPQFSNLFNDWYANLIGSIAGPVFEGGRRKAEAGRARAVAEERLAIYRETVLNAIKEVENALVSEKKQREYTVQLDRQLAAARRSYEESVNRYRNGLIEYTTVLVQLNILQRLERDYVVAHQNLLRYRIDLYRALGGSWPEELSF